MSINHFETSTGPNALQSGLPNTLDPREFSANAYYAACAICGAVYQTPLMRTCGKVDHRNPQYLPIIEGLEKWKIRHADQHSPKQHRLFRLSGLALMPEAAYELAKYGIVPVVDMVMDDEVESALKEAP